MSSASFGTRCTSPGCMRHTHALNSMCGVCAEHADRLHRSTAAHVASQANSLQGPTYETQDELSRLAYEGFEKFLEDYRKKHGWMTWEEVGRHELDRDASASRTCPDGLTKRVDCLEKDVDIQHNSMLDHEKRLKNLEVVVKTLSDDAHQPDRTEELDVPRGRTCWEKLSCCGPFVLIQPYEHHQGGKLVPILAEHGREVTIDECEAMEDAWVLRDRRGRYLVRPLAALSFETPRRLKILQMIALWLVICAGTTLAVMTLLWLWRNA